MIILGLTGSIGMGKSTTAGFFAEEGIPVYSADRAVHELYRTEPVIAEIRATFPETAAGQGIDRKKLAMAVFAEPEALRRLEKIIHPHVRQAEAEFLQQARRQGHPVAVLDIPLLFETDSQKRMDYVVVVSAPFAIQKKRVLSRPDMTEKQFAAILACQMPDEEKRKRADFIINTGRSPGKVREDVRSLIKKLMAG